ncbi:MAG: class I SAM-dependent methyltransferase [Candidatus Woesearchaeota archaeon]
MTYYDKIAKGYNELHGEEQKKKLAVIKENLVVKGTDKLLDVGCGTGLSSGFGCEVFGLDPSKELLKQCPLPDDHKILGKAEKIPFKDSYFDIVISVTAVHNFDDIEKGISEMKRVGKGRFVFSVLKSTKSEEIKKIIEHNFMIEKEIEEEKDIIIIAKKIEKV